MSIEHMAAVLHHSRARGTHKLVLLGIANHEGDGGAYPSIATLAKYANTTPRSVQRSIAWLVERGEVRVWLQDGDPRKPEHERTNRYAVLIACPTWCDRTPHHRDTRRSRVGQHDPRPGLWIDPVTLASPPDTGVTPPLTLASPPPVTLASPKPPIEPNQPVVGTGGTARAREDTRPCKWCDQGQHDCQRRQSAWPAEDQHPYEARASHASG